MTTATNTITVTINNVTFEGLTFEQAKELSNLAQAKSMPEKPAPRAKSAQKPAEKPAKMTAKPKPKRAKGEARHIEVQSHIKGMATRAINKARKAHGIAFALETKESYCVTKKGECHWAWLRCTDGKLNHDNGEAVAESMGEGWVYSPARNAIRRVYDHDIRKNH